jgi:hypothetical protein
VHHISGQMGAQHFVLHEEEEAFADWMNRALSKDKHVQHHLPLAVCKLGGASTLDLFGISMRFKRNDSYWQKRKNFTFCKISENVLLFTICIQNLQKYVSTKSIFGFKKPIILSILS